MNEEKVRAALAEAVALIPFPVQVPGILQMFLKGKTPGEFVVSMVEGLSGDELQNIVNAARKIVDAAGMIE